MLSLDFQNRGSIRPEVFCKKRFLRNFTKFTGKHLRQSLYFNKVAGLATLFKKKLWHRCFPVNFEKFLRATFLQRTSGRRLLEKLYIFPATCVSLPMMFYFWPSKFRISSDSLSELTKPLISNTSLCTWSITSPTNLAILWNRIPSLPLLLWQEVTNYNFERWST